jgi:hypothetical protein
MVAVVTGILFGIVPALVAARLDPWPPLKEGGRESGHAGRNVLRHVLVASEVALTLVVLVAAGLMIKSMVRLVSIDPWFDPRNVLAMDINLPQENLYYGPPGRPRFCEEIEERVASLPGVRSASAAAHLPMRGNAGRGFNIEGRPAPRPEEGRLQRPWLRTTTRFLPDISSSGRNARPTNGCTPRTSKNPAVTRTPDTCGGRGGAGNASPLYDVGSLYPILCRLEDKGLIAGRWMEKAGERRRRFYRLTPAGRTTLVEQRGVWERLLARSRRRSGGRWPPWNPTAR